VDDSQNGKRIRYRHLYHHALDAPQKAPSNQWKNRKISAQTLLEYAVGGYFAKAHAFARQYLSTFKLFMK